MTNQDEEIWINMLSYKDHKNRDKFIVKMFSDNESQDSYEIFKANYFWLSDYYWTIQNLLIGIW
jgi:hypothetical protein